MTWAAAAALVLVAQVSPAPSPRAVELDALLSRMVELSPELSGAVLAVRSAMAEQERAQAPFELRLAGEAGAAQDVLNAPSLGQVFGALEVRESLRLDKGFQTGTRLSLSQQFLHGAAPNALRNLEAQIGLFTPEQYFYDLSAITLTVTQPLLRGAGGGADLAAYRAALRGVEAAQLARLAAISRASVRAAAAYYALYVREQELEIAARAAERDAQELELTRKRIALGIVPASDLLRLQQVIAARAERAMAARLAVSDAERALRSELGLPGAGGEDPPLATLVKVPGPPPTADRARVAGAGGEDPPLATLVKVPGPPPAADRARVASAAAASHPAVLAARQEVERRREQLARARDAARPALDLSAFAGSTGFDPGSPAGALLQTALVQRGVYGVGVSFSVPLDNPLGRAEVAQAEAELARAEAALRREEQEASRAAVAAAEAAENAAARLELAEKALALGNQALAAERDRYGQGRGTMFDVLSAEAAVADAERRQAQVRADLLLARFALRAATGELGLKLAGP